MQKTGTSVIKPLVLDIYIEMPLIVSNRTRANKKELHTRNSTSNLTFNRKPKSEDTDICYICNKSLIMKDYRDCVRDYCHIARRYRGAAQNACNLQLRLSATIPVVFHNLCGHDSHLLMQATKLQGNMCQLHSQQHGEDIPFSAAIHRQRSVPVRLARQIGQSRGSYHHMHITKEYEPDDAKRNLLLRKSVYP